jgi:hypothetical protein
LSVLAIAFYTGFRWRAVWKSAPIVPRDRESNAWVENSPASAEPEAKDEHEANALLVANERLKAQIERAEAWRDEQEERQRRAEQAAKARCDQLLEENRALSDEVRSLRDSTTAPSPDLTNPGQSPEPPVDLPSGVLPGSPGSGNFLDARAKQVALKRNLTRAFGKEKAALLRQRSEAVAEMFFSDA